MSHPNEPSLATLLKIKKELSECKPLDYEIKMLALNSQIRRKEKDATKAK